MEDDDAAPDLLAERSRVEELQEQVEALRMELAGAKAEVSPTFSSLFFTFSVALFLLYSLFIWGGIFGSFPRLLTNLPPCPVLSCPTGEGCGGGA